MRGYLTQEFLSWNISITLIPGASPSQTLLEKEARQKEVWWNPRDGLWMLRPSEGALRRLPEEATGRGPPISLGPSHSLKLSAPEP